MSPVIYFFFFIFKSDSYNDVYLVIWVTEVLQNGIHTAMSYDPNLISEYPYIVKDK